MTIPADALFFDIETLPTLDADLIAELSAEVECPKNITKPESVAAWWSEKSASFIEKAVAKSSLDGGYGRLASVAWAVADGVVVAGTSAGPDGYDEKVERVLIDRFFASCDELRDQYKTPPTLIGHNVTGFDIRWLWHRALVLGIRPPNWWPVDARPWDSDRVQDTMLLWAGTKDKISQDRLARILGLKGKGDVDGSMIAGLWAAGVYEKIRLYNADDVRTTRAIWCRINGEPIPESEVEETVEAEPPIDVAEEGRAAFWIDEVPDQQVEEETIEVLSTVDPVANGTTTVVERKRQVVPVFLKGLIPEGELAL